MLIKRKTLFFLFFYILTVSNANAVEKRYFLDNRILPYSWDNASNQNALKNDLERYLLKKTSEEKFLDKYFHSQDAYDDEKLWKEQQEDMLEQVNVTSKIAEDIFPQTDLLIDEFIKDVNHADAVFSNTLISFVSDRELNKQLNEIEDFNTSIDGIGLISYYYSVFNRMANNDDTFVLSDLDDLDVFEKNTYNKDVYMRHPESKSGIVLQQYDDDLWSLWLTDMLDLRMSLDINKTDEKIWEKVVFDENDIDIYDSFLSDRKIEINQDVVKLQNILQAILKTSFEKIKDVDVKWFFRQEY
ncbi:MAG: hypothetical protein MJ250_00395 [Alphaproteobacteria bacterium]|nr:hypothetical protein [Alphaproteobacteria bacterium]